MCVEIVSNDLKRPIGVFASGKKASYSIRRLLKQLFRQSAKRAASLESVESLENLRNADIESECVSLESHENSANERLSCEFQHLDVPIRFVRTDHGTFFWAGSADVCPDSDLAAPLCCSTDNQLAVPQSQDRWAQA